MLEESLVYLKEYMKNKILLFGIILFLSFCFVILFKSLKNSNVYVPKTVSEKTLVNFNSKDFFSEVEISSNEIFFGKEFYILNITKAGKSFYQFTEHSFLDFTIVASSLKYKKYLV